MALLMATPDVKNLVGDNPADEHVFDGKELTDLLKSCGFKPELYYVIPNERAHITHKNKQWLGTNAPWTVAFRNLIMKPGKKQYCVEECPADHSLQTTSAFHRNMMKEL